MTHFCAFDVETANENRASICSLGIVKFDFNGQIVDEFEQFCFQDYFDPFNVSLHGITEDDVAGSCEFPDILQLAIDFVGSFPVVSHSGFDKSAFNAVSRDYECVLPSWPWYDSCQLARRIWPEFKNHKLKTICR